MTSLFANGLWTDICWGFLLLKMCELQRSIAFVWPAQWFVAVATRMNSLESDAMQIEILA